MFSLHSKVCYVCGILSACWILNSTQKPSAWSPAVVMNMNAIFFVTLQPYVAMQCIVGDHLVLPCCDPRKKAIHPTCSGERSVRPPSTGGTDHQHSTHTQKTARELKWIHCWPAQWVCLSRPPSLPSSVGSMNARIHNVETCAVCYYRWTRQVVCPFTRQHYFSDLFCFLFCHCKIALQCTVDTAVEAHRQCEQMEGRESRWRKSMVLRRATPIKRYDKLELAIFFSSPCCQIKEFAPRGNASIQMEYKSKGNIICVARGQNLE